LTFGTVFALKHSNTYLNFKLNFRNMGNLLYLIAVVLIILWIIGFLFHGLGTFGDGGIIHVLLVIAVILILLKVIRRAA